jgi:antitoxin component HigA of HigAB toxin-antitoxin module
MDIKPTKSEADYEAALKEIEELCDGQQLVEPQRARRTQRMKEKNFAPSASFAVKFCSRNL